MTNQQSRSLQDELEQLRQDCMTLALRLLGEDDRTFSPETHEVMTRWRPMCLELLQHCE